jgi:predicted aldo/keto reductase-like oxidoreductase
MRYTLSSPGVKTVIPGMASTSDVDKNVAYSDEAPFPDELRQQLHSHVWPRNFYK